MMQSAQQIIQSMLWVGLGCGLMLTSVASMATSDRVNYRVSGQYSSPSYPSAPPSRYGYSSYKAYADPYGTPLPQQYYPIRPPVNHRPPPYHGYPPQHNYPVYPQQNGLTIIYNQQFPQQTEYRTESHGFVNGNGTIESSSYTLISDWQRYNLPAPNIGMHWIFQNGRYLQMRNDR